MRADDGNDLAVMTPDNPESLTPQTRWARLSRWVTDHIKKLLGIVIVAIVGVVAQQVIVTCSAAKSPRPTQVHYIRLFDEEGGLVPPFKVTESISGAKCTAWSHGSGDPNSWRCGTPDNYIRDPCWSTPWSAPGDLDMACVDSPWDHTVLLLLAPKLYESELSTPAYRAYRRKTPWALQLRDPVKHNRSLHCVWVQGNAVQEIYGMRMNYYCWPMGHEWQTSYLVANAWGDLDVSHSPNRVSFTEAGSSEVRQADVTDTWP